MKKLYRIVLFLVVSAVFFSVSAFSQGMYEVSLNEKMAHSTLVVEGAVVGQESFWNPAHTMIFTNNTVEIYKVFKGTIQKSRIEVLTQGGTVGLEAVEVSELLQLRKGDVGVFFCFPNQVSLRSEKTNEVLFDVFASSQGFFKYDLGVQTANAPFVRYKDISKSLYQELTTKSGRNFENKKPDFDVTSYGFIKNAPQAPSITSFSPAIVTAGATLDPTNNVLTINGTGFGTASGSAAVVFDDAVDGAGGTTVSVAYNNNLMISWSATQIRVRVPSGAGTGFISVVDASNASVTSATRLEVLYSILTATFSSGPTVSTRELNLMNTNGAGGYSVSYSTNTAGSAQGFDTSVYRPVFDRALTTWREVAGLNFSIGATTTNQAISGADGVNLVELDNSNTGVPALAAGVLGVCYSFSSACTITDEFRRSGFDIVIRNPAYSTGSASFSLGPCPPMASSFTELDLETVILHELGHALNLGHINDPWEGSFAGELNPAKLMNFQIVNSTKRVSPDYSALQGALYVIQPQSNSYGCGFAVSEMTPLSAITESKDECPASFPATTTPYNTAVTFDLVHATSNKYRDPSYTQMDCSPLGGVALTNNAFYAFKTNSLGGVVSLTVSGYATTPSLPATCANMPSGYPTKGVELLLYQVSSCPSAQSFPAPIACRYFDGNGALASFAGLAANTNYLIMVDGLENTKANFTLTFTGSALPLNLSDFTGEILKESNKLSWTIDYARDLQAVYLERSADGVNFERIGDITRTLSSKKGSFLDSRPLAGNNYYRMAIINIDQTKEYSKVVLLRRKDVLLVNVYPNPARESVNVEINALQSGKYTVRLHNNLGQLIYQKEIVTGSTRQVVNIPLKGAGAGMYQVTVYNDQRQQVKSERITVQ